MLVTPPSLQYLIVKTIRDNKIIPSNGLCCQLVESLRDPLYMIYMHTTYRSEVIINEWVLSMSEIVNRWGPFGDENKFVTLPDNLVVDRGWVQLRFIITPDNQIDLTCNQKGKLVEREFYIHHRMRV